MKTAGDAWRLVSCFPKLRSGLFEEQGTPYSTEWFQIDFNESEQVWEGPLVPFKINLELFSSFRGSLLPKQITGKKLHFRKHGTGKKTAGDAWRQQGTRENSRGRVKTAGDAWRLVSCFPKLRSAYLRSRGHLIVLNDSKLILMSLRGPLGPIQNKFGIIQ